MKKWKKLKGRSSVVRTMVTDEELDAMGLTLEQYLVYEGARLGFNAYLQTLPESQVPKSEKEAFKLFLKFLPPGFAADAETGGLHHLAPKGCMLVMY